MGAGRAGWGEPAPACRRVNGIGLFGVRCWETVNTEEMQRDGKQVLKTKTVVRVYTPFLRKQHP